LIDLEDVCDLLFKRIVEIVIFFVLVIILKYSNDCLTNYIMGLSYVVIHLKNNSTAVGLCDECFRPFLKANS